VRLFSRPGNDLTDRFPLIVEALAWLRSRSCIIDGEAVCCDDKGVPSFDRIRYRRNDGSVFLYAFDLIELNGDDLRREPLEVRKGSSPRSGQDCPWPPMNLRTQSEWMRARVAANRDIGI
jgi:bifunctional non-homologous end joining protein LigD